MKEKSIKLKRVESILRELIPEALSTLSDEMLKGLCVTEVDCSRGKYDAVIYLDKSFLNEEEQKYVLSRLRKVHKYIEDYCMQAEGWYRCPKMSFKFDDSLEKKNRMDYLFSKIEKELKNG